MEKDDEKEGKADADHNVPEGEDQALQGAMRRLDRVQNRQPTLEQFPLQRYMRSTPSINELLNAARGFRRAPSSTSTQTPQSLTSSSSNFAHDLRPSNQRRLRSSGGGRVGAFSMYENNSGNNTNTRRSPMPPPQSARRPSVGATYSSQQTPGRRVRPPPKSARN